MIYHPSFQLIDVEKWLELLKQSSLKTKLKTKPKVRLKVRPKILEVGCGNCRNLLPFAKAGFDCYGIDFSKEMLKHAKVFCKKHNINVKLKQADATKLPFNNETFDYVLFVAVLHHLNPDKQEKALQEIKRVLKPNGMALITVWNKRRLFGLFKPKQLYIPWHIDGKTYYRYYYLFNFFELKKLLEI